MDEIVRLNFTFCQVSSVSTKRVRGRLSKKIDRNYSRYTYSSAREIEILRDSSGETGRERDHTHELGWSGSVRQSLSCARIFLCSSLLWLPWAGQRRVAIVFSLNLFCYHYRMDIVIGYSTSR